METRPPVNHNIHQAVRVPLHSRALVFKRILGYLWKDWSLMHLIATPNPVPDVCDWLYLDQHWHDMTQLQYILLSRVLLYKIQPTPPLLLYSSGEYMSEKRGIYEKRERDRGKGNKSSMWEYLLANCRRLPGLSNSQGCSRLRQRSRQGL